MSFGKVNHHNAEVLSNFVQDLNKLSHPGEERRSGRRGSDDKVALFRTESHVCESFQSRIFTNQICVYCLPNRVQVWSKELVVCFQKEHLFPVLLRKFYNNFSVLVKSLLVLRESSLSKSHELKIVIKLHWRSSMLSNIA